jgi:hypothetical protein
MMQLVRQELRGLEPYRRPILRFLTASKFFSLISQRAVWFSRLGALEDQFEGRIPSPTKRRLQSENRRWEKTFHHPEHRRQLREAADRNERDGRDLLAVSCWFADGTESLQMWQAYVGSAEGVAIESSCELLVRNLVHQEYARIGLVRYVDFEQEDMGLYLGNQAIERAFLKRPAFSGERELRIATMNLVAPSCLNPDGTPPTPQQLAGPGMFDPVRPGFFIQANVGSLVRSARLAPGASETFEGAVHKAVATAGFAFPIERSTPE